MNHQPYRNLPPLAGLCTMEEALKPGLPVEECVRRLKRFHYAFVRLHGMLTARITAEPIYELKTAFAHHAYLCAEHATAIRLRVGEMREPPLGLEEVPNIAIKLLFDELEAAPTTEYFVYGIYAFVFDRFHQSMSKYLFDTHPLTDAPSRRILKIACMEINEIKVVGSLICDGLKTDADEYHDWHFECLSHLVDDDLEAMHPGKEQFACHFSQRSISRSWIPQRDERFQDLWNQGVNAEAFLYSTEYPAKAKALMMLFKRLREIDVPEMMASILAQTPGKPWGYYRDMSRQIWDEARHAMMGEVGFTALGVDWTQARITHNWSYRLNTECTPLERHAVLYFIEQGLMPKTGKRYEYEVAKESGIPIMATIQDFDWADEVLHSQIGRQWLVPEFGSLQKCLDYGDAAWSKILSNWATVKENGLTEHANWWPAIYQQYCDANGETPDPKTLAFDESYEGKRADIHRRIPAE